MKNVLIVHAHPETDSFCSALTQTARQQFEALGYSVQTSDLYRMGFDPVGGRHDFLQPADTDYFKYQAEQVHAWETQTFAPELQLEMDKFVACDLLIFSFPLWWFGLPAILKGWVDRVFAMGLVYGAGKGVYDNGFYKDKKGMLVFTTGGPEMAYGTSGKNGELEHILFPIQHGMFYFAGMEVLEPFVSFAPVRKTDDERAAELERLGVELRALESRKRIQF